MIKDTPNAVDHKFDFYFSERQHCSFHENRQREDRDNERNY